ncbi:MAG TPA: SHOCT domain-containing protein [Dehalococcoidia bacterium]|nr:SHOCT domain-containing protein [Dehalococcoidia bacterium]
MTALSGDIDAGVAPVAVDLDAAGTQRVVDSNLAILEASAAIGRGAADPDELARGGAADPTPALDVPAGETPAIAPPSPDGSADATAAPPDQPSTGDAKPTSGGALERLSELQTIFDAGHITAEEFEQKKSEIIADL